MVTYCHSVRLLEHQLSADMHVLPLVFKALACLGANSRLSTKMAVRKFRFSFSNTVSTQQDVSGIKFFSVWREYSYSSLPQLSD